jgi:xanthine dehydrogenase small subunit
MRASSAYRMQAAQNLLRRFWLETRLEAPLQPQAVNAFACRA